MPYPPAVSSTIRDGGIGLLTGLFAPPLVVGTSSIGTVDTLYQFSSSTNVRDTLGTGDAVELACPIANTGGCLVLKTSATTAGASSVVTKVAIGTSTGTVTLAGAPFMRLRGRVEIRTTGTLGAGKFMYSLDGGFTNSEDITIPAGGTYVIAGTNITITFVPGGGPVFFEDGDVHTWTSSAPAWTTSNLSSAMTALMLQLAGRRLKQVFFPQKHASASAAATAFSAIATHLATLESAKHFCRAIMDAGTDTTSNVKTSFAAVSDRRICAVYGDADIASLNTFNGHGIPRVSAMNAVAERAAGAAISENLGRFLSGALRGVRAITHDEGTNTQFSEGDKITTLRTYAGADAAAGVYITNGYLKSPSGSDFLYYDYGRVIDDVCVIANSALLTFILSKVRTLTDGTGYIDPRDAARIDSHVNRQLQAGLMDDVNPEGFRGHLTSVLGSTDLANDVLTTRNVNFNVSAIPLPPIEGITANIGFTRSIV
jgi:hypothetical protein